MITYDEIYNKMRSEFEVRSRFDFDEKSDADIRIRVLAGEIFNAMTSIEWLKRQMFVATATGEYLDYFASQRGIERKRRKRRRAKLHFLSTSLPKTVFLFQRAVWWLRQTQNLSDMLPPRTPKLRQAIRL